MDKFSEGLWSEPAADDVATDDSAADFDDDLDNHIHDDFDNDLNNDVHDDFDNDNFDNDNFDNAATDNAATDNTATDNTATDNTATMKTNCILVGNGTSLLDAPRGGEIDAHGCVVRFNGFTLGKYELHTGVKCDVWFTGQRATLDCPRTRLPWKQVWSHSWDANAASCPYFQSHRLFRPGGDLIKVEHGVLGEISAYARSDFGFWSTGLIAIWLMLRVHEAVTITGFDWWEREAHHYNDKAVRGTLHRPELERGCIEQLAKEGRLSFL